MEHYVAPGTSIPAWRIEISAHGESAYAMASGASPFTPPPLYRGIATSGEWIVASAVRYLKCEGANFRGWIVAAGPDHTDPIPTKREALRVLRATAAKRLAEIYGDRSA